jgi:predicted SnoaL-like aldol condensation-catalyzing enzyme
MNNKESAQQFLRMAGSGKVREAYAKFIAEDFKHHNQYFAGDRQSLLQAMEDAHCHSPNKSVETIYAYEDGDVVITHSFVTRKNSDEKDIAVVHIFKFRNGKVVELWDVGQFLEKDSPNKNGPF